MKKEKIFFRVDGNAQIGLGHLIRCCALAQMLSADFQIVFVCQEIPHSVQQDFEGLQFTVLKIGSESEFITLLKANTFVVLDGYDFAADLQKKIKAKGATLVCIDDLHNRKFYADLIINHVPGVKPENYQAMPYTKFALGTNYALLRPAFLQKKQAVSPEAGHIMICFGGADPEDLSSKVLKLVLEFKGFNKITIVTGAAYKFEAALKSIVATDYRIVHLHALNEREMAALMALAEVGIVPASGILYEMLALNRVVITGMYIENQRIFLREFSKLPNVISCDDFSEAKLRSAISYFLEQKISPQILFDGQSGERLCHIFNRLKKRVYLITGANGGLGEAFVQLVLSKGHRVVSLSRSLSPAQEEMSRNNPDFNFIQQDFKLDISDAKLNQLKTILGDFSELIYINNAGSIQPITGFEEMELSDVSASLSINVVSPVAVMLFLLRYFPKKNMDFINITSGAANRPIANWALYSSAKAYMARLFSVLTEEHKENTKLRFISVDPGMIDTKMQQQIRSSDFPDQAIFVGAKEEGKLATAEEAALKVLNQVSL